MRELNKVETYFVTGATQLTYSNSSFKAVKDYSLIGALIALPVSGIYTFYSKGNLTTYFAGVGFSWTIGAISGLFSTAYRAQAELRALHIEQENMSTC